MENAEFADYFKILDKSSDRARTVIYVFIIVYVAMLLYALSAFAHPTSQFVYDRLSLQARCLFTDPNDQHCAAIKHNLEPEFAAPILKPEMKQQLWEHQLQAVYDDSVKLRTFTFPVFGLETDRDLLWVLFPIIGIIGYYIVLLALGGLVTMFDFLQKRNEADPFRLRMIQSTLVITTPLETTATGNLTHGRHGDIGGLLKYLWRIFAFAVFAIPVIVSLLMLADQTNAIAHFFRDPSAGMLENTTPAFDCQLFLELMLLGFQSLLFRQLVKLGVAFGACQKRVEALINQAEAPPLALATRQGQSMAAE